VRNAATLFGTPGGVDGLDAGVAALGLGRATRYFPGLRLALCLRK
jgi:hypothetical protein